MSTTITVRDSGTGRIAARPIAERFEEGVNRDGPVPSHMPHLGPCWQWTKSVGRQGYGYLFGLGEKKAHRVSWLLHRGGKLSSTVMVCHACDNPRCVNPVHLFLGDAKANVADMRNKGRSLGINAGDKNGMRKTPMLSAGTRNAMAKLTDEIVIAIRKERKAGASIRDLARKYSLAGNHTGQIANGKVWKHIDAIEPPVSKAESRAANVLVGKRLHPARQPPV